MKDEKAELIHNTLANLVENMHQALGENTTLTVFYAYREGDDTASGWYGNASFHEKIGCLEAAKQRLINEL